MDSNICNNLLGNDAEGSKSINFPVTEEASIDKLSKTFTRLLSYKVSQEVPQRYSVRLHIIDTLRNWSCINGDLGDLPIFYDSAQSCEFLTRLVKKYVTDATLDDCNDMNELLNAANVLQNLVVKDQSLLKCFSKVIEKITSLDQSEKSEKFLTQIIERSDELKLDQTVVETIYKSQKSLFIEKPLIQCFSVYCRTKRVELDKMNSLFEKIIDSPFLFQLVSLQLKDMFIETQYAQETRDFIANVLRFIEIHCEKYNKDTLDLYPLGLQYCVLLLRISPSLHTDMSKSQATQSLKEIFLKNHTNALILVSHFSEWLSEYLDFFEISKLSRQSQVDSCITIGD
ncbi:hypothetical protein QAD02_022289 [Eretmocerus hayati]|uniref:Uncharacterized protein n=1 Tax=Eretmocerus hayati TaxID=131215 RepID=A0ACC2PSW1_9HYME|nr:hypothetical protein QAD02_022289 [Eretmocerus hayati]